MMKKCSFVVLLVTLSASTSGAEDLLNVASLPHHSPLASEGRCAPPLVSETVEFYEVEGTCEKDLRQQLRRNGIVWNDGRKYDSITDWEMKWDYGYLRTPGSCSVDSFRVNVDIRSRYPRWAKGSDSAPADLADKWETYLQNLMDHEALHRYHVVESAKEISRAVAELPPAQSCRELDHQIRCLCSDKIKELREYQERYDNLSGHGAAQGAVFR